MRKWYKHYLDSLVSEICLCGSLLFSQFIPEGCLLERILAKTTLLAPYLRIYAFEKVSELKKI